MSKRIFERILLEAVDEGLSSLGESSRQAIYFHLDEKYNIKKLEIPDNIEAFAGAVESIFGLGANFLEIAIMRQLHKKVEQKDKLQLSSDLTFVEYVSVAQRSFLDKNKAGRIEEVPQCGETTMEI